MTQKPDVAALHLVFERVCSSLEEKFSFQQEDWSGIKPQDFTEFYLSKCGEILQATDILKSELTVYEVGCGEGDFTFELAQQGYQVVGVDKSLGAVLKLREKIELVGLEETAQARQVDLAGTNIDLTEKSALFSLHCCGSLADYVIGECRRSAKPSVVGIAPCCHNRTNPLEVLKNLKPLFKEYSPQVLYDAINFAWLAACTNVDIPRWELFTLTNAEERSLLASKATPSIEFLDHVRALALKEVGYNVTIAKVWDPQSICFIYGTR